MGKYIGYCVYRRSYLLLPPVTQTTRKNAPYPTYEYHIPAKHEWVLMYRRYIIDVDARRTLHALLLQEPARYLYLSQPPPTLTTSLRLLHLLLILVGAVLLLCILVTNATLFDRVRGVAYTWYTLPVFITRSIIIFLAIRQQCAASMVFNMDYYLIYCCAS